MNSLQLKGNEQVSLAIHLSLMDKRKLWSGGALVKEEDKEEMEEGSVEEKEEEGNTV